MSVAIFITSLLGALPSAHAAPLPGQYFGIADNVSPNWGKPTVKPYMERIGPKVYRVQIPYDLMSNGHPDAVNALKNRIIEVRQFGVAHVLVTFTKAVGQESLKYPYATRPTPEVYDTQTRLVIAEFDSLVDAWSPANEPNAGARWLGDATSPFEGPTLLAEYYKKLQAAIPPGDELVSPEFHDTVCNNTNNAATECSGGLRRQYAAPSSDKRSEQRVWIVRYLEAGGGWGQHAAFHPYGSVITADYWSLVDFADLVPSNIDIWLTEVGGVRKMPGLQNYAAKSQDQQVEVLINVVKDNPRISRAYYYMPWTDGPDSDPALKWDSGLINFDGTPRNIWSRWCGAAHNVSPTHPLCLPSAPAATGIFISNSNTNSVLSNIIDYGLPGDIPLAGKWTGATAATGIGIFRPSNATFQLRNSLLTGGVNHLATYGLGTDRPIVGDWNGDGQDSIGVFRNGYFYLSNSKTSGATHYIANFGLAGDMPIAGDWDGDGRDSIGVFRGGYFFLSNSVSSGSLNYIANFGLGGDMPLAGDWDGNGRDSVGVWRGGAQYFSNSVTSGSLDYVGAFGLAGDTPFVGDWDNNGTDTIGIRR